ncbi:MAG: hypothetical protein AABN33_05335 [Acidobacteriota bacterium]
MRKFTLLAVVLALVSAVAIARAARTTISAIDLSGTWVFSVDLDTGGHGDPTFVFKQDKENLTGSYDGPLGQYKVTGTVKDNKAVFGFEFTNEGVTHKATYTGTLETDTKMSGTVEITDGPKGKWTATKK